MTTWIFQGNPSRFDLTGYLRSSPTISWLVKQEALASEMMPGDRVFIWRAAGGGASSRVGVVAAGRIVEPPRVQAEDPAAQAFWIDRSEFEETALRARIAVDEGDPRFLSKTVIASDWELRGLTLLRAPRQTNYRISPGEAERLEALWATTEPEAPTAWLLIAKPADERQHAGNEGYTDDPERIYRFDSLVPNSRQIKVGDLAVIRSDTLLGVARIERVDAEAGHKNLNRCPSCARTSIKERAKLLPRFRCSSCGAEFDQPALERMDVTVHAAHFGSSFIAARGEIAIEELAAACPQYNGQLAMQRIDWADVSTKLGARVAGLVRPPVRAARNGPVELAAQTESDRGAFDPTNEEDARERANRSIALRRGQPQFRQALLRAYDGRCAITGCATEEVLEAAHIAPYRGAHTNHVQNGILLRADLHTLFDRGLLHVDPAGWTVVVSETILDPAYRSLHGTPFRFPARPEDRPAESAFEARLQTRALN